MNTKFSIRLLSKTFYKKFNSKVFGELLKKQNRPYLILLIKIKNVYYGIPFRSHIKHKYAFKLDGYKSSKDYAGLDFTKSIIIENKNYLGNYAYIDKKQFKKLNSEFTLIMKEYIKFLKFYKLTISKKIMNKREKDILEMCTLKYFK